MASSFRDINSSSGISSQPLALWEVPLEKEMHHTPVFLPGESHGQRRLAGYSSWDCNSCIRLSTIFTSFINSSASYGLPDFTLQNVWLWMTNHTIVVIWFIKIFFYSVLPGILSISSGSLQHLLGAFFILYCAHFGAESSLDVSNFPEGTASLSPFGVFFYH